VAQTSSKKPMNHQSLPRHVLLALVLAAMAITIQVTRGQTVPEAAAACAQFATAMEEAFDLAEPSPAHGYLGWDRYNSAPYLSSTHGNRYASHYANRLAAGYAQRRRARTNAI
jgi:hypothetical protein